MLVGAILVVGPNTSINDVSSCVPDTNECLAGVPTAAFEVLGESVLQRTITRLQGDGIRDITVIIDDSLSMLAAQLPTQSIEVGLVHRPIDVWFAADRKFDEYIENGAEMVLVMRLGAHVAFDLNHLLQFHRAHGRLVTRAHDATGPLDFWVINAGPHVHNNSVWSGARITETSCVVPYQVTSYVNRLANASDLRRLAVDSFLGHAGIRPNGIQVKAGVWVDDGARVHRRARLVAPAYIGRGVKVQSDALITRCSSLERGCEVGYGTVVEDASVLAGTYLGTGLDVAHAIVFGRNLVHLRHKVLVEIDDPQLLGATITAGLPAPRTGERPVPASDPDILDAPSHARQPAFVPSKLNAWAG